MTAYVNDEQKKEGAYGKAVKATLAATLAAGMVPAAAAFADEPAEAAEGNDVEVLAATPEQAWKAGNFTAVDNNGKTVVDKVKYDEFKTVEFANDGKAHWVVPTVASLAGDTVSEDLKNKDLYKVTYYKQANGAGAAVAEADFEKTFSAKGDYSVVVEGKADTAYAGQKITINFSVGSKSLKDAKVYQVAEDKKDVSDKTFTYTGKAIKFDGTDLNLEIGGEALEYGTDYTAEVYPLNEGNKADALNAGTYLAKIAGVGNYAGENITLKFDVEAMDLASAAIKLELNAADKVYVDAATVDGVSILGDTVIECTSRPDSWYGNTQSVGEYVFKISAKQDSKNVKGSVSKTEIVATNSVDVLYDGVALTDKTIDLAKKQSFDLDKLVVTKKGEPQTKLDPKKDYAVEVYDADGKKVDAASLKKAGKWTVKVVVNAKATEYAYAGEASAKVTVYSDTVNTTNVFFKQDGKVVDAVEKDYDGADLLKALSATVLDSEGKALTAGTDYTVVAQKKVDGKFIDVDSIVDKGEYQLVVKSDTYNVGNEVLKITVKEVVADTLRIAPEFFLETDKVSYTGEALVPTVQYQAGTDKDGKAVWKDLPADTYKLSYKYDKDGKAPSEDVKEIKEVGKYSVTVADAADDNFAVSGTPKNNVFSVTAEKDFVDVPNTEWYYQYVKNANKVGYMTGIGGTKLFAPNEATSRAMAATVLSRMAGGTIGNGTGIFDNPFTDVTYTGVEATDPWYATYVLWAADTRIVTGYEQADGTAQFRPEANVTRAEFCVMMQRYAKAIGKDVALEAGEADKILAKYDDGAAVADWAKEAVAWAVKNEIFGGYSLLNPAGDITRAEMAKMTTEFQAAPLTK
ncbi:hypothetical protein DMP07_03350 [Slackia faecicanis]|uniref:SLH domain-containing protein n=1 Tax=Slackia faecicanis TaxID=255723 RepID=A0A3N0AFR8_9ACTN|nr:S-layer homology domain-containing protein [Slackia faecicanis]RNL20632.1 hypothetical protein DMP07_03350 [Slackia faecicanis]